MIYLGGHLTYSYSFFTRNQTPIHWDWGKMLLVVIKTNAANIFALSNGASDWVMRAQTLFSKFDKKHSLQWYGSCT